MVYTTQTIYYDIELNSKITDFINYVKNKIMIDFNINDNYDIEIVEAGQFNNINGVDAELSPALESSDLTLLEKYGNNYKQMAFYIRKKPAHIG